MKQQVHKYTYPADTSEPGHIIFDSKEATLCGVEPFRFRRLTWRPDQKICEECETLFRQHLAETSTLVDGAWA